MDMSIFREMKPGVPLSGMKASVGSNTSGYGSDMNGLLASLRRNAYIDPEAMAGQAATDVQHQIDLQRESNVRQQAEMGLSPRGFTNEESIYGAAVKAGAANRARLDAMKDNFGRFATVTQMSLSNRPTMGGSVTIGGNRGERQRVMPTGKVRTMGGWTRNAMNGGRF